MQSIHCKILLKEMRLSDILAFFQTQGIAHRDVKPSNIQLVLKPTKN